MKWVLAFVLMALVDFVWAKYTEHITKKNAVGASLYSTVIVMFNGVVTIGFVADHTLLIPTVLGAFAGTYIGVKLASV